MTRGALPLYREVIDLVASADASFSCFVADRSIADPVSRFGSPWRAYEKLAVQLLLGSIPPGELVSVVADNYSTPDYVVFEQDVRAEVNRRLGGLGLTSVCRMDSKAAEHIRVQAGCWSCWSAFTEGGARQVPEILLWGEELPGRVSVAERPAQPPQRQDLHAPQGRRWRGITRRPGTSPARRPQLMAWLAVAGQPGVNDQPAFIVPSPHLREVARQGPRGARAPRPRSGTRCWLPGHRSRWPSGAAPPSARPPSRRS